MAEKKMTLAQAIKFVDEAQKLSVDEIDKKKLVEAAKVISAEAQRSFLERGARQIVEFPTDLDESLGDVRLGGADTPFLEGAGRVIDEAFAKANDLVRRVFSREASVRDERVVESGEERSGPGRQAPPPVRVPGPRGSADPAIRRGGPSGPRIPSELLNRLDQAAERAGVSAEEVQSIVEQAQQSASGGGLPPEVAAAAAAAGLPPEATPSVEELLEGQIAEWTQGAIGGLPEGFTAVRDEEIPAGEGLEKFRLARGLGTPTRSTEVVPRYFVGDEWQRAGMPPERIIELQKQLEIAGQLTPGDYYSGVYDQKTAGAMQAVMGMANASGQTWEDRLKDLVANPPESVKEARNAAALAKQFQAPAFLKMDKAAINQTVKSLLRQELRRDPTPAELAELGASLAGFDRAAYDAEVSAMRSEFEAGQQGLETGVAQTPGAVQDVDPRARFGEAFDRRFAPELDFIEGQEDQIRNATNVFASLRNMTGLIGR